MSQFYEELYKIKNIERKGWLMRGAKDTKTNRVESDAEHSFSMTLLALEIMTKRKDLKLDQLKVLKMSLIHEICEADNGDYTPFDDITPRDKHQLEENCLKRISLECDMPEILELWQEFEDNQTPEAHFCNMLDKLDTVMQAYVYSKQYKDKKQGENLFKEFYDFHEWLIKDYADFIK